MKVNRRKHLSCMLAVLLIFTLIMGSVTSYADSEIPDKHRTVKSDKPAYKEGELLIKFKDGTSSMEMVSFAAGNGLKQIETFESLNIGLYAAKKGLSTAKVMRALGNSDNIEYIQPNYLYYPTGLPNDENFDDLWGLNNNVHPDVDIDAPEAWDITQGEDDIVVAVIDTGIDINHPELSGNIWTNPDELPDNGMDDDDNGYVDDIYGWDFYGNDSSVFDEESDDVHGTHVAGTIAASANDGGVVGTAPNVKIMPLKFIGPEGGSTADAIAAINYAKNKGVKIVNCSWGGPDEDLALKQAIEQSEMLFVVAAGNEGSNIEDTQSYPASFGSSNILAVAAVDSNGNLADFSNYGSLSVDVGAPGVDILSTVPEISAGTAAVTVTDSVYGEHIFAAGFGLEDFIDSDDAVSLLGKAVQALNIEADDSILLVDDDGGADVGIDVVNYYSSALSGIEYSPAAIHEVVYDSDDGPELAELNNYDAVLWFTGRASGTETITTITNTDQDNLMNYIDQGGKLLIFGEDALYRIENSDFVSDYLNIQVTVPDYGRNWYIEGAEGTSFAAEYSIIKHNPYRDHIEPLSEFATVVLNYGGGFLAYESGTSMAAPHVAGIAALLLSKNPNLAPDQIKAAIMESGNPLASLNGKTVKGELANAYNALKAVAPANPTNLAASKSGLNINLSWSGREVGDFKEYIVERKINYGDYSVIANTTDRSYTDEGIDTSKTYKYRVKAVDKNSNVSGYSNVVTGNTGNGGSSGSGGSGGSSGGGSAKSTAPNPSIDNKIEAALKNAEIGTNIEVSAVNVNGTESASLSAKIIDSLGKSGKYLTLAASVAEITIPSSALMTDEIKKYISDSAARLSINVKEINGEEAQKLLSSVGTGRFKVGERIFDFTAELKTSKDIININKFAAELKLSLKLNSTEISGIDSNKLGVYYYNSDKKAWEYAGGVFNAKNGTITFETDHFSKYAVMRGESTYTDIVNHWAKPEIELMSAKHIIEDDGSNIFGPDVSITRAEVIKMLVNMLRYNPDKSVSLETPQTATFIDVPTGSPYFSYVETAVKHGIVMVGADKAFNPNATITREQLAAMIIRALGIEAASDMSILTYGDKDKIPAWAASSIIAAYERGYIQSINGKDFGIGSKATRAQVAVIIKRVMEKSGLIQVPEKLMGKLVINNMEGQHFELETKDGIYVLTHDIESKLLSKLLNGAVGRDVEVSGYEQSGYNIYQRGKVFRVISITIK